MSFRSCVVFWPLISLFKMPAALFAAACWSVVRVEGGVGGPADGKGMISAGCQFAASGQVRERTATAVSGREGGLLTRREGDDGGEWRVRDSLIHRGRRPMGQAASIGVVPCAVAVSRHDELQYGEAPAGRVWTAG